MTKEKTGKLDIFGSFFLGSGEFALSVADVQEVVNPPEAYTAVPLSPPFLKGLFNLRGTIVPVVDLRVLLKLEEAPRGSEPKIAIVERSGLHVGLLFDQTGEIFRSHPEERNDFERSEESVVSGVFKKDEGKRLIQILSADSLLKLQNVPFHDSSKGGAAALASRKRGHRKQCISFLVGPSRCSLGIEAIQEILKVDKVNASALSVHQCMGTIDLRGTTVPVIDFAALLGYREKDRGPDVVSGDRRVVVMKLEKEFFGLMVDAVENIVSYFPDDLIAFPVLSRERTEMFLGCVTQPPQPDILLLNHEKILSGGEIHEITHGHSKLYSHSQEQSAAKKKGGPKRTYITFTIENTFAVGIEEVREILELPPSLLHPPGLAAHFRGVLNLRGEMVTIVDGRALYRKAAIDQRGKVLIFKSGTSPFGLVVDTVEEIVSFSETDKVRLPELLYKSEPGSVTEDILEAVQVNQEGKSALNVMILNVPSIAARVEKGRAA